MRVKGSYKPKDYEFEVLDRGETARIRLYENVTDYKDDDDSEGYEFDRYTIERANRPGLEEAVKADVPAWLAMAKQEEFTMLATVWREQRDRLLSESDYTQSVSDLPISDKCRENYKAYRQSLRDLPEQSGFPYDIEFPEEPEYEKE